MTTIKLDYPVTVNGQTTSELNMRRPRVEDQLAVDSSGQSKALQEINLFANLAEVTPDVIKKLDLLDYHKLQEEFQGFLSPSS